jgi:hypothetical protein
MRKLLLALTLTGAALVAPGLASPAHARVAFRVGAGFHAGPLQLSLVFGQPLRAPRPGYFYRSYRPIVFPGYTCGQSYFEGGYYYYDRGCPLVTAYFQHYNLDPQVVFQRYAPQGGYYDGGGYDGTYDGNDGGYYDNGYYDNGYDDGGYYPSYGYYDGYYPYYGGYYPYISGSIGFFGGRGFFRDGRRFDGRDHRFDGRFNVNAHRGWQGRPGGTWQGRPGPGGHPTWQGQPGHGGNWQGRPGGGNWQRPSAGGNRGGWQGRPSGGNGGSHGGHSNGGHDNGGGRHH